MSDPKTKILKYIQLWRSRGYADDIPDEAPPELMTLNLVPSYRAICLCILKNDLNFTGLGFSAKHSEFYDALKRIELQNRKSSLQTNAAGLPSPGPISQKSQS